MADADVILTAHSTFRSLGLKNTEFRISHRGLIAGFLEEKKLTTQTTAVLRAVDKLDKQGENKVSDELNAAGINKSDAKEILNFVKHNGTAKNIIADLASLKITNPQFNQALENLKAITELLAAGGMKSADYIIDLKIARGFDYYTGVVFEMFLKSQTKIGSIGSGGRYDNLLGHYHKNQLPGVGASIGLSRLFGAIKEDLKNGPSNPAQVLIVLFAKETANYSLKVAEILRQENLNVLVYPGFDKISKSLGYADKLGIPFVVLCGEYEEEKQSVTIKNMTTGDQKSVSLKKAAAVIRKAL